MVIVGVSLAVTSFSLIYVIIKLNEICCCGYW